MNTRLTLSTEQRILKGQDVFFENEKMPMKAMAISDRYIIVSRKLDLKSDKDLLKHEVKMGSYCTLEEAFNELKDYPVYKILDFVDSKMGPNNQVLNSYDYNDENDCERCLIDLSEQKIELSKRHSVSLNLNHKKTFGAKIKLICQIIDDKRSEFNLPQLRLPVLGIESILVLEFSFLEKINDDTEWIKVSPNTLLELKPITHPNWEDAYSKHRWNEVVNDANLGITFAFYWKDGFLCWER